MYNLQICYQRVLTPEEGQAQLAKMSKELASPALDSPVTSWGIAKIEGTIQDNPFPTWIRDAIMKGIPSINFDRVNFFFFKRFETQQEAEQYQAWLEKVKTWEGLNTQQKDEFSKVVVHVMEMSADIDSEGIQVL